MTFTFISFCYSHMYTCTCIHVYTATGSHMCIHTFFFSMAKLVATKGTDCGRKAPLCRLAVFAPPSRSITNFKLLAFTKSFIYPTRKTGECTSLHEVGIRSFHVERILCHPKETKPSLMDVVSVVDVSTMRLGNCVVAM